VAGGRNNSLKVLSMHIVLLGSPGVGKGTQARLISQRYNVPQISTGDLLREALCNSTPLGLKAKKYMGRGELVPDELMIALIEERLNGQDTKDGFILDGFPRTIAQARGLDRILRQMKSPLDLVLEIEATPSIIIRRLEGRRLCQNCGKDYHLVYHPPRENGVCDECGSRLYQRKDDRARTIKNRLRVYRDQTLPLREYYSERGILGTVSGNELPLEVFGNICAILEKIEVAGYRV